jgi:hypothetical protein
VIHAVTLCSHKMFVLIVSQLQRLPVLNAKDITLILKCQNALNVNLSVTLQHWPNVKAVTTFGILKKIIAIWLTPAKYLDVYSAEIQAIPVSVVTEVSI